MSQSHFDSVVDYLIAIDKGEIKNIICTGFLETSHSKEPRARVYNVGKNFYSHVCPLCGFGSAGGISKESYQKWIDYKNIQKLGKTEES